MSVLSQTHLVRRGTRYYFRRKVPAALQSHYGTTEIRKSLGTSDKAIATRLAEHRSHELSMEFASLLKAAAPKPQQALTDDTARALAGALAHHILTADEEQRVEGMDEEAFALRGARLTADLEEARRGYARGDASSIDGQLTEWLSQFNIAEDTTSDAYKKLRREFLTARLESIQAMLKRDAGDVVHTPARPQQMERLDATLEAPPKALAGTSLEALMGNWQTEKQPQPKTVQMAVTSIAEFKAIIGHTDASRLTAKDGVRYKDALLAKHPNSAATSRRKFMSLGAILRLAKKNHRIESNPLEGLTIELPKRQPKNRTEFPPASLQKLFGGPVHTKGLRPAAGAGEAAKWLPLIALYMGMRQAEIGQLFVDDIKTKDGIAYIDINEERGKSLKNEGSIRLVPIHPQLVKLGLLVYVKSLPKGSRLFPMLRPDVHGSMTGNWSKWFGRYLRGTHVGISDSKLVFHSLRHNFKTACRDAGIGQEVHDALTGHADDTSSMGYGEVSLVLKQAAIAKIVFAL